MPKYDARFFEYVNSGAIRSARSIIPHLLRVLEPGSVLDVGCGQGAWLAVWKNLGVTDIMGLDGDYVSREHLLVPQASFRAHDLTTEFSLNRRFDLVQCLEVAEHLPLQASSGLIKSLVAHSNLVLFSAAPKGQGGDNHINEQSYDFWRALFRSHNYQPIDYLRSLVHGDSGIEPWYRYNTFLYASELTIETLPAALLARQVPSDSELPDISPASYRLRKALVRLLPVPVMTCAAKIKEHIVASIRGRKDGRG